MFKLLNRYIAKTIFLSTGLVALVMSALVFVMTVLGEFKNAGQGDYTFGKALVYVVMRLPNDLYQFSPLILLLGVMIALGLLTSNRELPVMRSSGFTLRQITESVFAASLALVVLMTLIGEWAAPHLSYIAEVHKENAENAGTAVVTASGVWFHLENNFIHVQRVVGRNLLEGVTRYEFNKNKQLKAAYHAETLTFEDNQWWMNRVSETQFIGNRTKSKTLPKLQWNLSFNTNLLNVGLVEAAQMPLPKLYRFMRYLKANGLQSSEYQYDFWQRIFQPLSSLVMIFLAIPFVIGSFSRMHQSGRVMFGIFIGFVFFIADAMLAQLCIVYQLPAMFSAFIPPLAFAILAFVFMRRLLQG